jgi:hypothetical protein
MSDNTGSKTARVPISAFFGSQRTPIPRSDVLTWEMQRARKTLKKFGQPLRTDDLSALRRAVVDMKLAMGRPEIERRLARELAWSDRVTGALARASGKRRRLSQIELFAPGFAADHLPAWYLAHAEADDEAVFLAACPDHHLFRTTHEGGQEVWETTGGSPLASRFFVTIGDTDDLVTPADPTYPVQLAGAARLADGTLIGGIRHQFRDEPGGLRTILTVEFPWLIGPIGPRAHRWHLACEFSTWIESAGAELG